MTTLVPYTPRIRFPRLFDREFEELDRWFDEVFNATPVADWYPRADIVERDDSYEITVELPGLEKDDVKVSVENNVLTVSGENKVEHKDEGRGYYRLERRYGTFCRSFRLPEGVDTEKISATYKNGLLKLSIPKAPEVMPKRIEIKD